VTYAVTVPANVPIGGDFTLCVQGMPGSVAALFVGTQPGATQTKFGTLCIELPAILVMPFQLSSSGEACFPCDLPCQPYLVGATLYLMAIIGNGQPGQAEITDCSTLTIVDDGSCSGPTPGSEPGDFVSYTQGAYGATCSGGNPACLLQDHFDAVFPNGLLMGDPDGADADANYSLLLTSAAAVAAFLPEGMPRDPFDADLVDPINSSAGVLGGQLTAARINVAFDAAGLFDPLKAYPGIALGDLVYVGGVHPLLLGKSVDEVIALTEQAVASLIAMPMDLDDDTVADVNFLDLNDAVALINTNFDNGIVSQGYLMAP
jgi:hypothetical protein